MMQTITETNRIPVAGSYDVIVAGGGVAGIAAALSAKRAGKSVLLIEKSLKLGGLATLGLINLFVPMCNGRGVQIISGLCDELVRLSVRRGYDTIPENWRTGKVVPGEKCARYVTRFSENIAAMEYTCLMEDEGIALLLDTVVSQAVMEGNVCKGLITESKSGREFYAAKEVIDVTGECDLLYRAGVPTVQGGNFFTFGGRLIDIEHCRKAAESGDIRDAVGALNGGIANLYGGNHPEGMPLINGTTAPEITKYILDNYRIMLRELDKTDRFTRDVIELPGMPQFRTTRRIDGDYTLAPEDCYRHFEDSVCAINDFDHRDYLFEVPLRCLTRHDCPNLLTAGRSASARGYAWDIVRVIPPAIATGQAAGLAAAHAIDEGCAVADVNIASLQSGLESAGLMIHFDDSLIPEGSDAGELCEIGHN